MRGSPPWRTSRTSGSTGVGTAAALIVAPLLFLIDNLIHPEELARGNELEQVRLIADAYTRWQAAHAIGFLAILAFAPAVLGLAFLVRRRRPGYGLLAGALALAGVLGLAAVITIDGYAWGDRGRALGERARSARPPPRRC